MLDYLWEEDVPYQIWGPKVKCTGHVKVWFLGSSALPFHLKSPCRIYILPMGGLIILKLFYVLLMNISLMWRHQHCWWRAAKFKPMLRRSEPLSREGSLSCHTYWDMHPRFFWSHLKDHPIQSPVTTRIGMRRIYFNPDPHGVPWKEDDPYWI
jgi:hypothetical protein